MKSAFLVLTFTGIPFLQRKRGTPLLVPAENSQKKTGNFWPLPF